MHIGNITNIYFPCDLLCCVAEEEEEEVIGADPGISSERARGDPAPAAPDAPIAINCVQETLDVRKVMAMAGSKDSFVQISNHLDQIMPGTEPVPSIRGEPIGRRAGLKRKAADISRSTCDTFAFLTTKNFSREDAADLFTTFCNVC